jgi:predicted peroxiredoxin
MSENEVIDFAIVMTSGTAMPQRLTAPFFLAATAAAEEMKVVVYFTGMGTELLKKGVADSTFAIEGGQPIRHFMDQALRNGAQFVLCKTSMDLFKMTADDVAFDLPMLTVSEALPYLANCKKIISF